ncbi:hypothetical protein MHU86_20645 [Fragilaria crotonensis]|nr:hypothetical protein MHU86_20645 [Fragilaria crotonensis]
MGPASGRALHSYRAEAYGLLSLLRFLGPIKEYTGMHEPWVLIATNSLGVLNTLKMGDKDIQAVGDPEDLDYGRVVLDCLRSEWDILIEIQTALQGLPNALLRHVKGHQGDRCPYHALDLLAQPYVDADKQAGDHQLEFGTHRPFVIMSPRTRAHLHLPDGTVTGRYKEVLVHEWTTRPLLEYIRTKQHSWTEMTLCAVHLEAHAQAIKRTSVPHTHLVKSLHNLLPTHTQANKFDGGTRQYPGVCTTTLRKLPSHPTMCA